MKQYNNTAILLSLLFLQLTALPAFHAVAAESRGAIELNLDLSLEDLIESILPLDSEFLNFNIIDVYVSRADGILLVEAQIEASAPSRDLPELLIIGVEAYLTSRNGALQLDSASSFRAVLSGAAGGLDGRVSVYGSLELTLRYDGYCSAETAGSAYIYSQEFGEIPSLIYFNLNCGEGGLAVFEGFIDPSPGDDVTDIVASSLIYAALASVAESYSSVIVELVEEPNPMVIVEGEVSPEGLIGALILAAALGLEGDFTLSLEVDGLEGLLRASLAAGLTAYPDLASIGEVLASKGSIIVGLEADPLLAALLAYAACTFNISYLNVSGEEARLYGDNCMVAVESGSTRIEISGGVAEVLAGGGPVAVAPVASFILDEIRVDGEVILLEGTWAPGFRLIVGNVASIVLEGGLVEEEVYARLAGPEDLPAGGVGLVVEGPSTAPIRIGLPYNPEASYTLLSDNGIVYLEPVSVEAGIAYVDYVGPGVYAALSEASAGDVEQVTVTVTVTVTTTIIDATTETVTVTVTGGVEGDAVEDEDTEGAAAPLPAPLPGVPVQAPAGASRGGDDISLLMLSLAALALALPLATYLLAGAARRW